MGHVIQTQRNAKVFTELKSYSHFFVWGSAALIGDPSYAQQNTENFGAIYYKDSSKLSGRNASIDCARARIPQKQTISNVPVKQVDWFATCAKGYSSQINASVYVPMTGYYSIYLSYHHFLADSENQADLDRLASSKISYGVDSLSPIRRCNGRDPDDLISRCDLTYMPTVSYPSQNMFYRGSRLHNDSYLNTLDFGTTHKFLIYYLTQGNHEIWIQSDTLLPYVTRLGVIQVTNFTGSVQGNIQNASPSNPAPANPPPNKPSPRAAQGTQESSVRVRYEDPGSVIVLYFTNRTGRDQRCSGSYDYTYRIAGTQKYQTNTFSVLVPNNAENSHTLQGSYVDLKVTSDIRMQCS